MKMEMKTKLHSFSKYLEGRFSAGQVLEIKETARIEGDWRVLFADF
jgi:hypothetical protein